MSRRPPTATVLAMLVLTTAFVRMSAPPLADGERNVGAATSAAQEPTLPPPERDLVVALAPAQGRIEAAATLRLRDMGPDEPVLEINSGLEVLRVEIDGRAAEHRTSDDERRRLVTVIHPERLAGVHTFRVLYAGAITTSGEARAAPIDARGVFLEPRHGWYPRLAGVDVVATRRLAVDLPPGWAAVSEGRPEQTEAASADAPPQGRAAATGGVRTVWRNDLPSAGQHLAAGRWKVEQRAHRGVRLAVYLGGDNRAAAAATLDAIAAHLDRYAERFGAYPFPALAVIETARPAAGFPGVVAFAADRLARADTTGVPLAREVVRGWWGHGVSPDREQGDWSAGLTAYLAEHALAAEQSAAAAARLRRAALDDYMRLATVERDYPLSEFRGGGADVDRAIGRDKSMLVFHMLERRIGRQRFDEALGSIRRGPVPRRASWTDLRDAFTRAAGEDLGWFFEQWVMRAGAPRLALARVEVREGDPGLGGARPGESATRLELAGTLRQEGGVWRIRVPLLVDTPAGVVRRTVEFDTAEAAFRIPLPDRPRALRVDPDSDVLLRLDAPLSRRFPGTDSGPRP